MQFNFIFSATYHKMPNSNNEIPGADHFFKKEPLYEQEEAEDYIFMNPVKRERLERGWTQQNLAERLSVKQSTIAKWERKNTVFGKKTRQILASVFGIKEDLFL